MKLYIQTNPPVLNRNHSSEQTDNLVLLKLDEKEWILQMKTISQPLKRYCKKISEKF